MNRPGRGAEVTPWFEALVNGLLLARDYSRMVCLDLRAGKER